jgi:hypothetical protein
MHAWGLPPGSVIQYSGTSISGTALSGRKPISGGFSVRSDSFHRQFVQRSAELSCKRELHACVFPLSLIGGSTACNNLFLLGLHSQP